MNKKITVKQAIGKGYLTVVLPFMVIMCSIVGFMIWAGKQDLFYGWAYPLLFLLVFVLPIFYWALAVPKWRVWAFERVINVHELKKTAMAVQFMYPEGSFGGKMEMWSARDKQRWEALQYKFLLKDEFHDDGTAPPETVIHLSVRKFRSFLSFMLTGLVIGIFCLVYTSYRGQSIVIIVVSGICAVLELRKRRHIKTPQIIINDKGIETTSTPFCSWKDITGEEVVGQNSYLVYNHPGGAENVVITDMEVSGQQLEKLLKVYRQRYEVQENTIL